MNCMGPLRHYLPGGLLYIWVLPPEVAGTVGSVWHCRKLCGTVGPFCAWGSGQDSFGTFGLRGHARVLFRLCKANFFGGFIFK